MKHLNLSQKNLGLMVIAALFVIACSKEGTSAFDDDYPFDEDWIDLDDIELVDPDNVWIEEIGNFPEDPDFTINGQDYFISLEINDYNSEVEGTIYSVTILLCNLGHQGIDDFRIDLTHNGTVIYDTSVAAFPHYCQVFHFTNIYQGKGLYEARIKLPGRHHDFNLTNNQARILLR